MLDIASRVRDLIAICIKFLASLCSLLKVHRRHRTSLSITQEAFLPSNQRCRAEPLVVALAARGSLSFPEASTCPGQRLMCDDSDGNSKLTLI